MPKVTPAPEPEVVPEPDEFGRYRVTDKDTGHVRSIHAAELPHGNYAVLEQPASDPLTGLALAAEFSTVESTSGQEADTKKEKSDA